MRTHVPRPPDHSVTVIAAIARDLKRASHISNILIKLVKRQRLVRGLRYHLPMDSTADNGHARKTLTMRRQTFWINTGEK
jgi:hypothetical protein